jgi:hypothetical protein
MLPWGWTWTGVLDVSTSLATVLAALLAWRALRAIHTDRRITFELEQLREVRMAVTYNDIVNNDASVEQAILGLALLPRDLLPLCRGYYEEPHFQPYEGVGGQPGTTEWERRGGGAMSDGRRVVDHLRDEVDAEIKKRLERSTRPWWRQLTLSVRETIRARSRRGRQGRLQRP